MRVLIIGGGIGGLTAALALRRRGLPVAVYEAASGLVQEAKAVTAPPVPLHLPLL